MKSAEALKVRRCLYGSCPFYATWQDVYCFNHRSTISRTRILLLALVAGAVILATSGCATPADCRVYYSAGRPFEECQRRECRDLFLGRFVPCPDHPRQALGAVPTPAGDASVSESPDEPVIEAVP